MVAAPSTPSNAATSPGSNSAPSRVCRLRGLPYSATDDEIGSFFKEYTLEEVYICRRDGRATGEAYVMFSDAAQAGSAMEKCNKKYLRSRYIELFEAAEADLAAVKKVLEDMQLQGCVVRLRGLPYTATAEDVVTFFEGAQLAEGDNAIVFTTTVDGRPTGECYVELADRDAQNAAMMRHKELMGSRYIEVFHSNKMDKLQAQQQRFSMPPTMFGRWDAQPMRTGMHRGMGAGQMQPAVVAAATAAGNKVACGVGHLARSLQGTHLNNSVGRVMSPMQQQPQQLYQQPYPQRQMLVQSHMVRVPAAAAAALGTTIDSSSNISTGNSIPSVSSGSLTGSVMSAPPGPMTPAVSSAATNGAYYQSHGPAPPAVVMSQPGGGVINPAAMQMRSYGAVFNGAMSSGAAMGPPEGPMQQQMPQQVYYMPLQQRSMPPPYGVPAPGCSMPPAPPAVEPPYMMHGGHPRPMLVGGGQWMHARSHWPQPSWPAAGMASPAAMGGGAMQ